jgi:deazaflavin-dependent oxidoreductase (nitroreductase family)
MPLPRRMARFNKQVTNRISRHVAGWAPGFAIVHHTGRRSGRAYETPVNVFRRDDGYVFALTYGRGEWVENVLAAGRCEITTRRRTTALVDPQVFRDPQRTSIPVPARWILALVHVDEFLSMRVAADAPSS